MQQLRAFPGIWLSQSPDSEAATAATGELSGSQVARARRWPRGRWGALCAKPAPDERAKVTVGVFAERPTLGKGRSRSGDPSQAQKAVARESSPESERWC